MTETIRICDQQENQVYGNFGDIEVWPGKPYPLGATWSPAGVNFAVFSENASRIDLCLFTEKDPNTEAHRIQMMEQTDLVWHCFIPDLKTGWRYGFRAHGEWNPLEGKVFNPNKLLIDPYTKAIDGTIEWNPAMFPYPLRNYWGYNSLSFFAPHADYASSGHAGEQVREFKDMVKKFHKAGIEVILDVVYNHTAEGNHYGPMLGMKGLDNLSYYRLKPDEKQYYMDYTGTGNTVNMLHPRTLQLVMDSLRYWVVDMQVDGFRFDLASALARGLFEVGKLSTFLDTIHQDPIISQVKLIAEPWDVGPGGYQVGNFPVLWSEWNGKYRDNIRSFWRGDEVGVGELAYRLSGSSDLYELSGRKPSASINFITAHDGFTLRDLWSYNEKHNEANGEDNRDGDNNNHSWNCGVEGPTDDKGINTLRARMQRNMLATLFLSQGVPMLTMGDEYGRTQNGNNNAYCQDNEISWFNWNWTAEQRTLHSFTRALIRLRRENPIFHRRRFFNGRKMEDNTLGDILWVNATGHEMTNEDWSNSRTRSLGMILNGEAMVEYDERGRRIKDDIFLLVLNAWEEGVNFTLPGVGDLTHWECLIDTDKDSIPVGTEQPADTQIILSPRSLSLYCLKNQKSNLTEFGKRKMNIVDQVRRLWEMIQE